MRQAPANSLVTIYGGSGFVGRHMVRALVKAGYRIRVAVRRPELAGFLQPLGMVGQIHAVQANVRNAGSVERAAVDADFLINLVGILYERGAQRFQAVHVDGARTIAEAAAKTGAGLLHVSAIGADVNSRSLYARSKALGEAAVLAAVPQSVIFRPSIQFGPEDDFFNRFAGMARLSPALPLVGGGHTRFQPVFVGDVAKAALAVVNGHAAAGTVYELGGPEVRTFRELLALMLRVIGRKRLLLPLPFALARLQAFFLEWLPKPILTRDQVALLETDNVVSAQAERERRTLAGLGVTPTALEAVLASYLVRFRRAGQFSRVEL